MPKHLFMIAALLLTPAAFAEDKVGDRAIDIVHGFKDGKPITGTVAFEILQVKAEQKSYLMRLTERMEGEAEKQSEGWKSEDEFSTAAAVESIFTNCEAYDGKREEITVTAGKFPVCTTPLKDENQVVYGTLALGRVPFGLVRMEATTKDGKIVIELKEFQKK